MNRIKQLTQICFFLSIVFVASGCGNGGGAVGYVSGKVTVPSGKNTEGLLVRFVNGSSGVGATAVVAEDGSYSLKHKGKEGVPIGLYIISVTAYVPHMTDREIADFMDLGSEGAKANNGQAKREKEVGPQKVSQPTHQWLEL